MIISNFLHENNELVSVMSTHMIRENRREEVKGRENGRHMEAM